MIEKKRKDAKGDILWIDEELVGFKCECGKEIVVSIEDSFMDANICPKCGKRYILKQTNIVYEV